MQMSFVVDMCATVQSLAHDLCRFLAQISQNLAHDPVVFLISSDCFLMETILLTIYSLCFRNHSHMSAQHLFSSSYLLFFIFSLGLNKIKYLASS